MSLDIPNIQLFWSKYIMEMEMYIAQYTDIFPFQVYIIKCMNYPKPFKIGNVCIYDLHNSKPGTQP